MDMDTVWSTTSPYTCGDCGATEGAWHHPHCDQAVCNRCGGQYLSCDCVPQAKRRVRFIMYPQRCARCGCAWPEHFFVSHKDWCTTVQKDQRESVLCRPCFEQIRRLLELPPCPWTPPKPRPLSAAHALAEIRDISLEEATTMLEAIATKYAPTS